MARLAAEDHPPRPCAQHTVGRGLGAPGGFALAPLLDALTIVPPDPRRFFIGSASILPRCHVAGLKDGGQLFSHESMALLESTGRIFLLFSAGHASCGLSRGQGGSIALRPTAKARYTVTATSQTTAIEMASLMGQLIVFQLIGITPVFSVLSYFLPALSLSNHV